MAQIEQTRIKHSRLLDGEFEPFSGDCASLDRIWTETCAHCTGRLSAMPRAVQFEEKGYRKGDSGS
jgi:hypothetical protein